MMLILTSEVASNVTEAVAQIESFAGDLLILALLASVVTIATSNVKALFEVFKWDSKYLIFVALGLTGIGVFGLNVGVLQLIGINDMIKSLEIKDAPAQWLNGFDLVLTTLFLTSGGAQAIHRLDESMIGYRSKRIEKENAAKATPDENNVNVQIKYVDKVNEKVVIRNEGSQPIAMEGWYLKSVTGNQKINFNKYTLSVGEVLEVESLKDHVAYDAPNKNIWNKKVEDEAILFDDKGQMISNYK